MVLIINSIFDITQSNVSRHHPQPDSSRTCSNENKTNLVYISYFLMSIAPPQLSVDIMFLLNEASGQLAYQMEYSTNGIVYRNCLADNWCIHNIRLIVRFLSHHAVMDVIDNRIQLKPNLVIPRLKYYNKAIMIMSMAILCHPIIHKSRQWKFGQKFQTKQTKNDNRY